ncbi:long-chain-fatty-acid-CoA ligase [Syncephalis fuscata]|nr:long-chain-fatty-acid-CoA ligase [Syncephalis fuscata]
MVQIQLPDIPMFRQLVHHAANETDAANAKPAIVDANGSYTYRQLLADINAVRQKIAPSDLNEQRVAALCTPGYNYVVTQWAVWAAGGVFVPLCILHTQPEVAHYLQDADCSIAVVDPIYQEKLAAAIEQQQQNDEPSTKPFVHSTEHILSELADSSAIELDNISWTTFDTSRNAMFLYTSGTTGKPKGVVSTHTSMLGQIKPITDGWKLNNQDRLINHLPLHHAHALLSILWSGATVEIRPKFDAEAIWERLRNPHNLPPITILMFVPAMYSLLLKLMEENAEETRKACKHIRVMTSGSSSLTTTVRRRWYEATGHVLLERYGMTETGMLLGGSLEHPDKRVQGCVGWPFPTVEVRIMSDAGENGWGKPDVSGEVQVRGPGLFKEYWRNPKATKEAWTDDFWFRTGDVGEWTAEGGCRLLGRTSIDIIKSGGYKLSSLEIERVIIEHPDIQDCAVVGVDDETWGQRVAACIVLEPSAKPMELKDLKEYVSAYLARYKFPTLLHVTDELPRNTMRKVDKKQVIALFK